MPIFTPFLSPLHYHDIVIMSTISIYISTYCVLMLMVPQSLFKTLILLWAFIFQRLGQNLALTSFSIYTRIRMRNSQKSNLIFKIKELLRHIESQCDSVKRFHSRILGQSANEIVQQDCFTSLIVANFLIAILFFLLHYV